LQLVDLQYSDIRPDRGLALRLEASGRLERITSPEEVTRAMERPPDDTRAYFRGECLRRYGEAVAAASWDSVIFDIPGHDALQRVPTLEPVRGTRDHVGHLLDAAPSAADLLESLRGA
ncbi:MAG: proteasome accessory factor PafA2 family protein, partial [Actinomycetota bacterium]